MIDFYQSLLSQSFLQHAFIAGILISFACGVMGTFVVIKRISFAAGGIAHATLGGMGIAYYFHQSIFVGALIMALCAALIIGYVTLHHHEREDTLIGAIWSVGMAIGILFTSKTPGYSVDLLNYLFGNILFVTQAELLQILLMDIVLGIILLLYYREFVAVCFDEEFARLRGIAVNFYYYLLLCLIALTVVLLIKAVGLILLIALLTLPAAIANHYSHDIKTIMFFACLLSLIFCSLGLILSYHPELPAGATIILVTGVGYFISLFVKSNK